MKRLEKIDTGEIRGDVYRRDYKRWIQERLNEMDTGEIRGD